jgi:hypothetical protein
MYTVGMHNVRPRPIPSKIRSFGKNKEHNKTNETGIKLPN